MSRAQSRNVGHRAKSFGVPMPNSPVYTSFFAELVGPETYASEAARTASARARWPRRFSSMFVLNAWTAPGACNVHTGSAHLMSSCGSMRRRQLYGVFVWNLEARRSCGLAIDCDKDAEPSTARARGRGHHVVARRHGAPGVECRPSWSRQDDSRFCHHSPCRCRTTASGNAWRATWPAGPSPTPRTSKARCGEAATRRDTTTRDVTACARDGF
jgi:hypothetical protein